VTTGRGSVEVAFTQAKAGWDMLRTLKTIWGGSLRLDIPPQPHQRQSTGQWRLHGKSAKTFCKQVGQHALLKREQLQIAANFPILPGNKVAIRATGSNGEVTDAMSRAELGRKLNIPATCIFYSLTKGVPFQGYRFSRLQTEGVTISQQQSACQALKDLKRQIHAPVDGPLNLPYIAGFVEADGCLASTGSPRTPAIKVFQKHPAIVNAFHAQYKGCVLYKTSGYAPCWEWTLAGKAAVALLTDLIPFLRHKRAKAHCLLDAYNVRSKKTDL
jgi:hypothetical protein